MYLLLGNRQYVYLIFFTAEGKLMLLNCRSDAGICGMQLIVQSSVKVNTLHHLYVSQQMKDYKNPLCFQYETLMMNHDTGSKIYRVAIPGISQDVGKSAS